MRSMQSASSDASWTVTMSAGSELVRNGVSGEDKHGTIPSNQNSVFLRINLDEDDFPLFFEVEDEPLLLPPLTL